jgi:menaquinone-dependent protoporphyrinogen IX oxidase
MNILAAYASRNGATTGIAERLAARIGSLDFFTTVRRVDTAGSLGDYGAIVFGAPVYDQSWPPEAEEFAALHRDARKEPRDIARTLATLRPRGYRVFRGVIRKDQWPFWSQLPRGDDYVDTIDLLPAPRHRGRRSP